jgi:hypothetical protein
VDGSGNAYVTGYTWSTDYDVTPGAFQTTKWRRGGCFCDEAECDRHRSGLFHLHRGEWDDVGYGIAVDGSGNAYVTGYTSSTNYDVTPGAFQTTNGGGVDVFVTKLNATGTALVYSTYIGGSGDDGAMP